MAQSMYLTYEEYVAAGGTLDAAAYPAAELKARRRIDAMTLGRVARMRAVPDAVKAAMLLALDADAALADAPDAASFATDGYSETCPDAARRAALIERQLRESIELLLYGATDDDGHALIYAGIGSIE